MEIVCTFTKERPDKGLDNSITKSNLMVLVTKLLKINEKKKKIIKS